MFALYQSIVELTQSCGVSCTLAYSDIHRSVCCFFLVFDDEKYSPAQLMERLQNS